MRTSHAYRVTYEDNGEKPAKVEYFIGKTVAAAFTNIMNMAPSGARREIVAVERVLANVINPDVAA